MKLLLLATKDENMPFSNLLSDTIQRINNNVLCNNEWIENFNFIQKLESYNEYTFKLSAILNNKYFIYNNNGYLIGYLYIVELNL